MQVIVHKKWLISLTSFTVFLTTQFLPNKAQAQVAVPVHTQTTTLPSLPIHQHFRHSPGADNSSAATNCSNQPTQQHIWHNPSVSNVVNPQHFSHNFYSSASGNFSHHSTQLWTNISVNNSSPNHSVNLDLSSNNATMTAGHILHGQSANINIGGTILHVTTDTKLTPAEYLAVKQIELTGQQSLTLNVQGSASGGTVVIGQHLSQLISNLVIPQGVTIIDLTKSGTLNLSGNLTDYGNLYLATINPNVSSITVNSNNLTVQTTGILSTSLPSSINLPTWLNSTNSILNLNLIATNNISNAGNISSNGSLNLSAGSGNITNSGSIASAHGNININAPITQNLALNATGGRFSAPTGAINLRDSTFTGSSNISLTGGDYLSKDLSFYGGNGTINANIGQVTGQLTTQAQVAHINTDTPVLTLGSQCLTGDPTYANTGAIFIDGVLTITGGANLAIVSGSSIIATDPAAAIVDNGGNILLIAGANITGGTAGSGTYSGTNPGGAAAGNVAVSLTGGNGGSIDFSASNANTAIDSSGTSSAGGNITLIALANGATGGHVLFNQFTPAGTINSSGDSTHNAGNITIYAGANSGSGIITNNISANGGSTSGNSGNVILQTTQATTSNGNPLVIDPTGTIISGNTIQPGSSLSHSGISAGSIDTSIAGTGNGGSVGITSYGAINLSGAINTYNSGTGNAGSISITSTHDLVSTQSISSYRHSGTVGNITISAYGAININSDIDTDNYGSGNAGSVSLTSTNDLVSTQNIITYTSGMTGSAGNITILANGSISTADLTASVRGATDNSPSGTVSLTSATSTITTSGIVTSVTSGSGAAGNVTINAPGAININSDISTYGASGGSAGSVSITSTNNLLSTQNINTYTSGTTGNGGNITISAKDSISTAAFSAAATGATDNSTGGTISLTSTTSTITSSSINTSVSSAAGAAGNVTITASGAINIASYIVTSNGGSGNAGSVTITSTNDLISAQVINTTSQSGTAGNITISAYGAINISADISTVNSVGGNAGSVSITSTNDLVSTQNINTYTSGTTGSAGNITISADGSISTTSLTASIQGATDNSASGTLNLTSATSTITNSGIDTSVSSGSGAAGNVTIMAPGAIVINADINTYNSGSGNAGSVTISSSHDLVSTLTINTSSQGTLPAGDVSISSHGATTITGNINAQGFSGPSGNINIQIGDSTDTLYLGAATGTNFISGTISGGPINIQANSNIIISTNISGTTDTISSSGSNSITGTGGETVAGTTSTTFTSNSGDIGPLNIVTPYWTANTTGNITLTDSQATTGNGVSSGNNVSFTDTAGGPSSLTTTGTLTALNNLTLSAAGGTDGGIVIASNVTGNIVTITSSGAGSITSSGLVTGTTSTTLNSTSGNIGALNIYTPNWTTSTTGNVILVDSQAATGNGACTANNLSFTDTASAPVSLTITSSITTTGSLSLITTAGDINLASTLTGSSAAPLTIVSAGNIVATDPSAAIVSHGGDILLIAGANVTSSPSYNTVISFAGGLGGNLDLNTSNAATVLDSTSFTTTSGNITLIALANNTVGGNVILNTTNGLGTIDSSNTSSGFNAGNVAIYAGANSGTSITTNYIVTSGGSTSGNSGNAILETTQATTSNGAVLVINSSGTIISGNSIQPGYLTASGIQVGSIDTSSSYGGTGSAGNITLSSYGPINVSSYLYTYVTGPGTAAAGNVSISTYGAINISGVISTYNDGPGAGGTLTITSISNSVSTQAINTNASNSPAGNVTISGYGPVTVSGDINAQTTASGNGGMITITSTNDLVSAQNINTYTSGSTGSAGNITISAKGAVNTANITTSVQGSEIASDTSSGGSVSITSTSNSVTTGDIDTEVDSGSGNGGNINISAYGAINSGTLTTAQFSANPILGNSGSVAILSTTGAVALNEIDAEVDNGNGNTGNISINAYGMITCGNITAAQFSTTSTSAVTGSINLVSTNSGIDVSGGFLGTELDTGSGTTGYINISAKGNIICGELATEQESTTAAVNNSGSITVTSSGGSIDLTNTLFAQVFSGSGTTGSINITAYGAINSASNLFTNSTTGTFTGQTGSIALTSVASTITAAQTLNTSVAHGTGSTGNIIITAPGAISLAGLITQSTNNTSGNTGAINVTSTSGSISNSGVTQTEITGGAGNTGNVTLNTAGSISLSGNINAYDAGSGNGGAVTLISANGISTQNIYTYSAGHGAAGSVQAQSYGPMTIVGNIDAHNSGTGTGGNVLVQALDAADPIVIGAASGNNYVSGTINANGFNGGQVFVQGANNIIVSGNITANGAAGGNGGLVYFTYANLNHGLNVQIDGSVSATNTGTDNSGNVQFYGGSSNTVALTGSGTLFAGKYVAFGDTDPNAPNTSQTIIPPPQTNNFTAGNLITVNFPNGGGPILNQVIAILAGSAAPHSSTVVTPPNNAVLTFARFLILQNQLNQDSLTQQALISSQINTRIPTDYTPWTTNPGQYPTSPLQGGISFTNQSNSAEALFAASAFNANELTALTRQGIIFGPATKDNFLDLVKGFILFMPTQNIQVQTREGIVSIPKGAIAWVMETGNDAAIYDLHDNLATGFVKVNANNKELTLAPGTEVLLTRNDKEIFDNLNPGKIAYRNLQTKDLGSGIKAYICNFSLSHTVSTQPIVHSLLVSHDPSQQKIARQILKNAAILSDLTGSADYCQ